MPRSRRSRAGRPRLPGTREKNGRLKRPDTQPYDKGSDWVQAQRAKYGLYYNTALGRAFAGGLLGEHGADVHDAQRVIVEVRDWPGIALSRYQAGRRFASLYTRIYGGNAYRCPLDRTPRGRLTDVFDLDQVERDKADQKWLTDAGKMLDGSGKRFLFDQLISSLNVDAGPYWLDAILDGGRQPEDLALLKYAIEAIDLLVPERRQSHIVAMTY